LGHRSAPQEFEDYRDWHPNRAYLSMIQHRDHAIVSLLKLLPLATIEVSACSGRLKRLDHFLYFYNCDEH
jgi:hypothetical protein